MPSIFLLIAVAVSSAFASDVIELTDSNFQSKAADYDVALMEFYAPWCGHCKRLAPEYEKAATLLKSHDPPIPLVKVDCTAETETCQKYGVSGYPTLKIFRNGEFSQEYNGPRETDGIVKYMKSQGGPSSRLIENEADMKKFISHDEPGVVGFFEEDGDLKSAFMATASAMREDVRFAHTSNKDVIKKYKYVNDDIVLFRSPKLKNKFEESEVKYADGGSEMKHIKKFINEKMQGLCGHRSQGNKAQFSQPLVTVYYDIDYMKNPKGSNYWRNRVMKVAEKFTDQDVNFAVSSSEEFGSELTELGLSFSDKPVVGARDKKAQKFPMKEEFSMDHLEAFVKDFLDGNLKPYLKSEPVPDNSDNAVKVAVAENFDELVNDKEKDVLIEFYAPWCGHCKSLAPKYEEVAEKLADEPGIVIAKMDATANDVPSPYQVSGFPTLYFAPKNSKDKPKKYEGGREADDFIKYLAAEATDELQGYSRSGAEKKKEEL